jgi:hypothetical protein
MSRGQAKKQIDFRAIGDDLRADEAPGAYERLDVLAHHEGTVRVLHTLRPVGVAMAGADMFDATRTDGASSVHKQTRALDNR